MKTLFLLRHGHAVKHDGETTDRDRPLDELGRKEVAEVAQFLKEYRLLPETIITSDALRARQTASIVTTDTAYAGPVISDGILYAGDVRRYLQSVTGVSVSVSRVLLVGHNPAMEDLLVMLTGRRIRLSPAALAGIGLPVRTWLEITEPVNGQLQFIRQPDA